jgi:hypothetical protein
MKGYRATTLIEILGIAGVLAILLGFPAERSHSETPTVKVPGPYPYETPVQVPAPPPVSDSSPLPSPAPFPYPESSALPSAAQDRDSRTANARRPLTAKAVREAGIQIQRSRKFLWISGGTSCQCQCIRSKTWNNTRACKRRPCSTEKCGVAP